MKFTLVTPSELTGSDLSRWGESWDSHAGTFFPCPLLRQEFVEDVAAVRDNVRIAICEGPHGRSYLPISVQRGGVAKAPAEHMSDFEAVIGPSYDVRAMLRACGLSAYRFAHLLADPSVPETSRWVKIPSPYVDLSEGFDAYRAERLESRGRLVKDIERKIRKAEREYSEVAFTFDDRSPAALEWLVEKKSEQLRERRQWDFLAVPWCVPLCQRIWDRQCPEFRGLVSTLRYDGRIVAAHFGVQSTTTLHSWVHCYDPTERNTSPGITMQFLLAKHGYEAGITRIDLGRGDEDYKPRFANGATELAEGSVERSHLTHVARRSVLAARELVRATPVGGYAQHLVRQVRIWKRNLAATAAH